jgi:hypothetical protein
MVVDSVRLDHIALRFPGSSKYEHWGDRFAASTPSPFTRCHLAAGLFAVMPGREHASQLDRNGPVGARSSQTFSLHRDRNDFSLGMAMRGTPSSGRLLDVPSRFALPDIGSGYEMLVGPAANRKPVSAATA